MKTGRIFGLLGLITLFLGIVMPGCSDQTFVSSTTVVPGDADPDIYIPLEQGFRISYVLLEPETEYFDVEITDPATVAGNPGFTVRNTDRNGGQTETYYLYMKDNAIFKSGSTTYPGEKILESPFVAGKTWNRFDTTASGTGITSDTEDDWLNDVGDDQDDGDPGNTLKNRPDENYGQMTITGFETVEAVNGNKYGNCLKVAWQVDESTYNYFWYAPGIGLIKFEECKSLSAAADGQVLGVMTDFQKVEY